MEFDRRVHEQLDEAIIASKSLERERSRSASRNKSRGRSPARNRSTSKERTRGRRFDQEAPPPSNVLGVFGLSFRTVEKDLDDIFSKYGELSKVVIIYDNESRRSKGFGFVTFVELDAAVRAREAVNEMEVDERRIRVDFSKTQKPHERTPGQYLGVRRDRSPDRRRRYRSRSDSRRRSHGHRRHRSRSYSPRRSRSREYQSRRRRSPSPPRRRDSRSR